MRHPRLPRGALAFGLPVALLVAALAFYFARGGSLTDDPFALSPPPCFDASECLEPSPELVSLFDNNDACDPADTVTPRICLVPLGDVAPRLVLRLKSYYETRYRIPFEVLPPVAIPEEFVLRHRPQYNGDWLFGVAAGAYPDAAESPVVNLIVLTPVDVWLDSQTSWNWAFGQIMSGGGLAYKNAIISQFRMDDGWWSGIASSDARIELRVRKMMNKYVAIAYFGMPFSPDPFSATYDHIRSARDLDRMAEHIPVE